MNVYGKIWFTLWVISIPLLIIFYILKEEFELFLWEFMFAVNVVIASSVPLWAIFVVPIVAIVNM